LLAHASAQRKGRSPRIHFQACDWLNFLWTFEMADDKFPRILTPEFRAVYVWTQKPQPPLQEGQDAKYKVGMLFDKSNAKVVKQLKTIIATADEMLKTRFPKLTSKAFQPWLRNGDTDAGLLLNNLMKLRDGERLAGKRDPESDFEEFASETGTEDDDALV
jgi:hypothetical protein